MHLGSVMMSLRDKERQTLLSQGVIGWRVRGKNHRINAIDLSVEKCTDAFCNKCPNL